MMTLKESVEAVKKYFSLEELVSKDVFERYGAQAWTFFDPRALETLYILRKDILQVPLVVNNWKSGGQHQQRGLRANMDSMMLAKADEYFTAKYLGKKSEKELEELRKKKLYYMTAHSLGNGFDFSSGKMTASDMRKKIEENKDMLPYPIRLENDKSAPTWCHFDMENITNDKIQYFGV